VYWMPGEGRKVKGGKRGEGERGSVCVFMCVCLCVCTCVYVCVCVSKVLSDGRYIL